MRSPATSPIPRRQHSIRRTSHIDMHIDGDELALHGMARDMITEATHTSVVANAAVHALVDGAGNLASLTIEPADADGIGLVGRPVSAGFRDAVRAEFPDDVAIGSPLALLLDDLPVAALISGYARLYSGTIPAADARAGMKSDICSGWRSDGTMMSSVRGGTGVPVTLGPTAPALRSDERPRPGRMARHRATPARFDAPPSIGRRPRHRRRVAGERDVPRHARAAWRRRNRAARVHTHRDHRRRERGRSSPVLPCRESCPSSNARSPPPALTVSSADRSTRPATSSAANCAVSRPART